MRTVLLVEGSAADAGLISSALQPGTDSLFEVVHAETLGQALGVLGEQRVHCVLLALGPPEAGGLVGLDAITVLAPWVPVVVLTGHDEHELGAQAVTRGAEDYLTKTALHPRQLQHSVQQATERAQTRAELRRTTEHLRAIVDSLGEGLIVCDADGSLATVNATALSILGLSREELTGPLDGGGLRMHNEDGTACAADDLPASVALRTGLPVDNQIMSVSRSDGRRIWLEVNARPLIADAPSSNAGVVMTFRDLTERRTAEESIRLQAELLAAVGQAVIATDPEGAIIYWNRAAERAYGWTAAEVIGRTITDVTPADTSREQVDEIMSALAAGQTWTGDFRVRRKDGTTFLAMVSDTPVMDRSGRLMAIIGVSTDVTEQRRSEESMRQLSAIVESTGDAVIGQTLTGIILSWNKGAERLYGYDSTEAIGQSVSMLVPDYLLPEIDVILDRVAEGRRTDSLETVRRHKDGNLIDVSLTVSPFYDSRGTIGGASTIARDISDRKHAERALQHQALHDTLTGLPNRTLLNDRMAQALEGARRRRTQIAVLFIDLDHFNVLNDAAGHPAGDLVLVEIASRLQSAMRPGDTVARFGGDEFVVLCEAGGIEDAQSLADRLHADVSSPIHIDGQDQILTASIGIAMSDGLCTPADLLRDSDAAMYQAKERGRGRIVAFESAIRARAAARLAAPAAIRRALDQDEFRLLYQPIIDTTDERVVGFEALIRWHQPDRGLVSPGDFVPDAEETGLIVPLGEWVINTAIAQATAWGGLGWARSPFVSVNISGRQLEDPELPRVITEALALHGCDPGLLSLEVTESVVMADVTRSVATLQTLRDIGVHVSIDDFGTGYSSLNYLKRLPVTTLKIDSSFVDGLGADPHDSAIVAAIIALARTLGLEVIAEGVETIQQRDELRALECGLAQGFLWAPAMSPDTAWEWVRRGPA